MDDIRENDSARMIVTFPEHPGLTLALACRRISIPDDATCRIGEIRDDGSYVERRAEFSAPTMGDMLNAVLAVANAIVRGDADAS